MQNFNQKLQIRGSKIQAFWVSTLNSQYELDTSPNSSIEYLLQG